MEDNPTSSSGPEQEGQEYQILVLLDELKSLLEDMEDNGISGLSAEESIPPDLKQRMDALGVHDVQQVRDRLMHLHAQVDEDDADLTTTES